MKILMLGCGNIGASVARQLVPLRPDIDYVFGDLDADLAARLAAELGGRSRSLGIDVHDCERLAAALDEVDLIFNTVGPYYRHSAPVIEAAIRTGTDYIDINDDHDVAERLFLDPVLDRRAREAGVRLIIGCGSTPGLSNVIARRLVDRLDQPRAIRLATAVPYSPALFSPAILDHMFHITSGEVTQFIDGQYQKMPGWGGRRDTAFMAPFKTCPAFFIGHGETVTLPHFIKGLDEVTNRIAFFPEAGADVWRSLMNFGLGRTEKIDALGLSPLEFLTHYLATDAGVAHLSLDLSGEALGAAFQVEVVGTRDGDDVYSVMEFHQMFPVGDTAVGADPTPICARLAIEAYLDGEVTGEGLLAPEACLNANKYVMDFARTSGATFHETETVHRSDVFA